MDRTRPLKHAPELVWEKPEERFRVAMEDVKRSTSAPTAAALTPATTAGARPGGVTMTATGAPMASSEGREGRAGHASSDVGMGVTTNESGDSPDPASLLSTPTPALDEARRDCHPQQQVLMPASSLTVSVWSKGSAIGVRQDVLLGKATVPARYIDHPPGDVWLPLAGVSNSTRTAATSTSRAGINQEGVTALTAGGEATHGVALSSEHPYTGAATRDATAAGGRKGGAKKSWGSGLFKRKDPKKRDRTTEVGQQGAVTAGSVRVWLGKVRRGSLSGQQPGKGHAVLRVHGASALRKVRFRAKPTRNSSRS